MASRLYAPTGGCPPDVRGCVRFLSTAAANREGTAARVVNFLDGDDVVGHCRRSIGSREAEAAGVDVLRGRVDLLGEGVDQGAPAVAVHKEERAARGRGDEAGDIVWSG